MHRFRISYIFLISVTIIGLIVCIIFPEIVAQEKIFDELTIIVSIASMIVALAALAISDKRELKATISAELSKGKGQDIYKIVIRNESKEDLRNTFVSLRMPEKVLVSCDKCGPFSSNVFGETKMLTFDYMKYFPKNKNENEFVFELTLNLSQWFKGHLWLTISAENYKQTTLRIKPKTVIVKSEKFEVVS